jgi:hypothetical protein
LEEGYIFRISFGEGLLGYAVFVFDVFLKGLNLSFFQAEDFFVDVFQSVFGILVKVVIGDGTQELLNVVDREDALKIVNENQEQNVLLGIFLFERRRKEVVFSIVVDHRLCDDSAFLGSVYGRTQLGIHKAGYLIHI